MDGYAVSPTISPARPPTARALPVAEDIPAGRTDSLTLKPGTAHRIMTGAPLPAGATAVVPVEATDAGGTPSRSARAPAGPAHPARRRGCHRRHHGAAGRQVLTPAALGLAAALGLERADGDPAAAGAGDVYRLGAGRPRHAACARPDLRVQRGHARGGGPRRRRGGDRRPDDRRRRRRVPRSPRPLHAGEADLFITTGGVSAGAYEVVKDALGGRWNSSRWRCSPACRRARASVDGTPIITLPGNPVSALVSFEVFIRSPLRAAMGLPSPDARGERRFDRGPDLAARASGSSGAACSTRRRAPSPATARPPRITCAGWRRRTACWRSTRTSRNWPAGTQVRVWDLA